MLRTRNAVNKAREAYAGGEQKSDPKDAFVIADQLRFRWKSLREVRIREENTAELRTLVGYRRDLLRDQRRRVVHGNHSARRSHSPLESCPPRARQPLLQSKPPGFWLQPFAEGL